MSHDVVVLGREDDRRFEARTVYYAYEVIERSGREIVVYRWHPRGDSPIRHAHVHLSRRTPTIDLGSRFDPVVLAEMHLPTGRIRLVDVVRLLIGEFDVAPRRADWEMVLRSDGGE